MDTTFSVQLASKYPAKYMTHCFKLDVTCRDLTLKQQYTNSLYLDNSTSASKVPIPLRWLGVLGGPSDQRG